MRARFSSEPASQYCRVRKYTLRSCAVPGIKRKILGSLRRTDSCWAPTLRGLPPVVLLPRSRLSRAMAPPCSPSMENRPMRVSFITSLADMQQIIASQSLRRASSASITAAICGSMNIIVAMMMSPSAMSSRHAARRSGLASQSAAACTANCNPGTRRLSRKNAESSAALT